MTMSPSRLLLVLGFILAVLVLLDRLGLWMERRGWIYWRKRRARGSVLGSAVLDLQKIFESGKAKHLLEAMHDGCQASPGPLGGPLVEDHAEVDRLFREAWAALEREHQAEAHRALDRVWMRLAVHIRAEHKVLFPAVAKAAPHLEATLRTLREDHDVFMTRLGAALRALATPPIDWTGIRASLAAVRRRLTLHNALEEGQVYPLADRLPDGRRGPLAQDLARELADLPERYGAGAVTLRRP